MTSTILFPNSNISNGGAEGNRFNQGCAPSSCRAWRSFAPHLIRSIPPSEYRTKRKTALRGGFPFGGAEGNRTPVRKQLGKNFSGRSLLFTFPHPDGNKHPAGFSSFMMHGALKALRTHGLHSNHTRARLVDLPGRMGA